jgi:hypothetical protein
VFFDFLAFVGGWVVARKCHNLIKLMFENRDGNSGRYKHWTEQ